MLYYHKKEELRLNNRILEEAKQIQEEIIVHRRWLHSHGEVGFDLRETSAYVRTELEKMGYEVTQCGKSGLVALVGKPGNKVFLLRADMDALPIREESGLSYACETGNMHACGHDLHTAMLLGAAKLLKKHEKELNGQVKLMFQPSEETLEGAKDMIDSKVLENPKVDAGMMIHVATNVPIPAGTILISPPGISAPAADYFTIQVKGKGCHGSTPQNGIDALTTAAHILIALQEINARELGIADRAVFTVGTMHAGSASNVIADSATMGGTIRCFDEKLRERIKERICDISAGIATAFRGQAEVTFGSGAPTLQNNRQMCDFAEKELPQLLGSYAIPISKMNTTPSAGGSEDFAYVSHRIPTVMLSLAAGEPEKGYSYPLHHPKTTFDEAALSNGTAALTYLAIRYLAQ